MKKERKKGEEEEEKWKEEDKGEEDKKGRRGGRRKRRRGRPFGALLVSGSPGPPVSLSSAARAPALVPIQSGRITARLPVTIN